MHLRMLVVLALCALLVPSAQAQPSEITPTDFIPLQVGNQWTYEHRYFNSSYEGEWREQNPEIRMLFEIPGYLYDNPGFPPDSLRYVERELTIEVTHTEMIDGLEYFVFSRADYDWPPAPSLSLAGRKVRFSDEGVLLFRWNGQDIPYLNFQHLGSYLIPAYPIREDIVTELHVWRRNRPESQIEIIFSAVPKINLPNSMHSLVYTAIGFLPRYGLTYCIESYYQRDFFGWELHLFFHNVLDPISAIISGEEVSHDQVPRRRNTHVQSSSWGQLKRLFLGISD